MATVGVLATVHNSGRWCAGRRGVKRAKEVEECAAAQHGLLERCTGGGAVCELLNEAACEEALASARRTDEREALTLALAGNGRQCARTCWCGRQTRAETERDLH